MNIKKGFTLLELLVVIAIIMVLTAAGVASYGVVTKRSRDSRRVSDLEQIRQGLEMYRSDNGYYPNVNSGGYATAANLVATMVTTYMPSIPNDPKNDGTHQYYYVATTVSNGQYYGYCLCANEESLAAPTNTCGVALPANCNYGIKNP